MRETKAMKTTVRLLLLVGTAFAFLASVSFSQSSSNIEVKKLNDNFYRLTSQVPYPSNFLAYVCADGILLVDSGQKETGQELERILKTIAVGNAEVRYLINTHAHIDHTGGNLALAGEPLIIAPEILRSTLRAYSYVLYEFPDKALPSITFSDSMTLYFGNEKIRIFATPGSHDATDVIVHFTNAGIVCLGDISYGMTFPSIDGYTGNLLESLWS
jgi:glyoxylase-like metal-dependent hydrolase (beta-lactamase superfamily II)